MTALVLSEDQIHRGVVAQLRARGAPGLIWWHTPNDGKRSMGSARRLKAMGMRAGVHDFCFVHRGSFYALELKTEKGRPTVHQMQFASDINTAGGHSCICHGLDRAIRVLECWGLLR